VAEALAEALENVGEVKGKRFLMLRADIARPVLRQRLEQGGAAVVRDVGVYKTQSAGALPVELLAGLEAKAVQWIIFSSSSAVDHFLTSLGETERFRLEGVQMVSIGPVTTKTLQGHGFEPAVVARESTIQGLVEALVRKSQLH
jgi:uroporphyrinogen III methyltransferase/synthase